MQYNSKFLQLNFTKFLVPSMLAILGGTVNVLIDDMMLAARLGSGAIATLNVCMPYFLFVCTLGSLIASGAAILSAQELGREATVQAKEYYDYGVTLFTIIGIVVTVLGIVFLKQIAVLLAGSGFLYKQWTEEYLFWIVIGTLPKGLLYFPFNYLPIEGNAKQCSNIMLTMLITNVILNYVFIYQLDMGMSGAGMASTIASLVSCCLGFVYFKFSKSIFVFGGIRFPNRSKLWALIKRGSPNALNNLCSAIRLFIVNTIMISSGGADMVATFAVINALSEFSLCFVNGVPSNAGPLTGIYFSEKNNKGLRIILRIQFIVGSILALIFGGIVIFQTPNWGSLFGRCNVDYKATVPFAISVILATYNSIMVYYYARCNRVRIADFITVGRLVLFTFISLTICDEMNRNMWQFLPLSELLTMLCWILMAMYYHWREENTSGILLLDSSIEKKGNVLDFSVEATDEKICEASEQISEFCEANEVSIAISMQLSMAIEEMLVLMKSKCYEGNQEESFDLRVFALDSLYGIRIRCMGKMYNPFEKDPESSDELMGVGIIRKLAEVFEYRSVLGANNIILLFEKEDNNSNGI